MNTLFDRSFLRAVEKIENVSTKRKIAEIIRMVENAHDIRQIKSLKKLKGYDDYYRIRIGTYRIGVMINNQTVTFITVLPRKDIYKYFP